MRLYVANKGRISLRRDAAHCRGAIQVMISSAMLCS